MGELKDIIELNNFTMSRGENVLLKNVTLNLKKGEIVFLGGGNGCGKTTLLSLFRKDGLSGGANYGGLFNINSETETYNLIACDRKDKNYSNFYYRNIAYLDQNELIESFAKVRRTLSFPTEVALYELKKERKITNDEYCQMIDKLNDEVNRCIEILGDNITDSKKRKCKYTKNLSGGQKRFVSFFRTYIRAVVLGANILVLDEPLNHLDYEFKKIIDEKLCSLISERRESGNPITILIVSHCLPFSFIKDKNCRQIDFTPSNGFEEIESDKKRFHDCLK